MTYRVTTRPRRRNGRSPKETLLGTIFDVAYDEMVIVNDIDMFNLCGHLLTSYGRFTSHVFRKGKSLGQ